MNTNITSSISSFASEFKAFISKGNVIDMAVGVIIGAAFGKIIASLVADVIMPLIGLLMGNVDVTGLQYVIREANEVETISPVVIKYGLFIQTSLDFMIVAFAIFIALKIMLSFKRKEEEKPLADPVPTKEQVLLTEIRDLLKK